MTDNKDLFGMPLINSFEIKKLIDMMCRETKGHTEFRIVVHENGDAYAHVIDRDSETVNFKLFTIKD